MMILYHFCFCHTVNRKETPSWSFWPDWPLPWAIPIDDNDNDDDDDDDDDNDDDDDDDDYDDDDDNDDDNDDDDNDDDGDDDDLQGEDFIEVGRRRHWVGWFVVEVLAGP